MFKYPLNPDAHLRLLCQKDAQELFDLVESNRDYLKKWLPWLEMTRRLQDIQNLIRITLESHAHNKGFVSAIVFQNQIAGLVSYHPIDWFNKKASLGYWLGENFQGKGLASLAVEAYVKYAFEHFELNRVEIHCATENVKSQAIPKKLGFVFEGTLREAESLYGNFVDHQVYSMIKKDFEMSRLKS